MMSSTRVPKPRRVGGLRGGPPRPTEDEASALCGWWQRFGDGGRSKQSSLLYSCQSFIVHGRIRLDRRW
jgi:hypothetical protein